MNEPRSSFEREVIERLTKIEHALGGDGLQGKGGAMHHLERVMIDVYGTENNRTDSFMSRMSRVEDVQKRQKWTLAGFSAALGLLGGAAGERLKHLFGG